MSSIAARYAGLRSAVAACCERLVSPAIAAAERPRVSRLAGSLLGSSFVGASAAALALPAIAGPAGVLAGISATLAGSWLGALIAASGKIERGVSLLALGAATAALPALAVLSGGVASPLVPLLAALAIEPWWVARTRSAAKLGGLALVAAAAALAAAPLLGFAAAPAQAWHWLPTLAYFGWVAARFAQPQQPVQTAQDDPVDLFAASGALALRLSTSGEVQDVRGDAMALFGVPAAHLAGSGLFERILVGDRVAFLCALSEARVDSGPRRVEALVRLARADGEEGPAHGRFQFDILRAGDGELVALISRNAEAERLREEVVRADDRCAEMALVRNRMLASVSHELRTPLNAIIGFSDMLLLELFGRFTDPRQKEYVALMRDSGQHLLGVVNSILDVSRLQSGAYAINPEPFELADSVSMCTALMAVQTQAKSLDLRVEIEPGLADLHADRRAVQQILINLLSNAVKFTPEGGRIILAARQIDDRLSISVSDTGIGIAAQDIDRLGEPFTQIHNDYTRQFDGAGLGLSLVKGLVALHGGTMSIDSAPGLGTTVTIALPTGTATPAHNGNLVSPGQRDRDYGVRKTA